MSINQMWRFDNHATQTKGEAPQKGSQQSTTLYKASHIFGMHLYADFAQQIWKNHASIFSPTTRELL
jgi:hypothetical protein